MKSGVKSGDLAKFGKIRNTDYDFHPPYQSFDPANQRFSELAAAQNFLAILLAASNFPNCCSSFVQT